MEHSNKQLEVLLREARPTPTLPPRFEESVWRRIEHSQAGLALRLPVTWVDRLASRLMRPRLAMVGIAALILIGGLVGVVDGSMSAREAAKEQYLVAVAPSPVR